MSIYKKYQGLLAEKQSIDNRILSTQIELYNLHAEKLNEKDNGTINVLDREAGFKLTVVKRETVSVDQKLAAQCPQFFKVKYNFDKKGYDASNDSEKKLMNSCLTTKAGKPSFKVEAVDE